MYLVEDSVPRPFKVNMLPQDTSYTQHGYELWAMQRKEWISVNSQD